MALAQATIEKEKETRGRKKLHHLRVHPMDGGGHLITHHAANEYGHDERPYKQHVFSAEQGSEAADHVAKHAKFHPPKERSEMRDEIEEPEEEE